MEDISSRQDFLSISFHLFNIPEDGSMNAAAFWSLCLLVNISVPVFRGICHVASVPSLKSLSHSVSRPGQGIVWSCLFSYTVYFEWNLITGNTPFSFSKRAAWTELAGGSMHKAHCLELCLNKNSGTCYENQTGTVLKVFSSDTCRR